MNCRPGDMARIVPDMKCDEWARGYIVLCVRLGEPESCGPMWIVDPELKDQRGREVESVADAILRPISPGGVTEEDVRELYAPKELVHV